MSKDTKTAPHALTTEQMRQVAGGAISIWVDGVKGTSTDTASRTNNLKQMSLAAHSDG